MDEIKDGLIEVLNELKEILLHDNTIAADLRKLSNELIENVTIFKDKDSITISVMLYSLYKIFSKNSTIDKKILIKLVDTALKNEENPVNFRQSIRKLFDQIKKYDNHIDSNIMHIVNQAYINKGLSLYEHGLSIGHASEMMGISKWEIMGYLSGVQVVDTDENARIDCRDRLTFTRGLFK